MFLSKQHQINIKFARRRIMNRYLKIISIMIAAVFILSFFSGCGSTKNDNSSNASTTVSSASSDTTTAPATTGKGEVVVKAFAEAEAQQDTAFMSSIDAYNTEHAGKIKFDFTWIPLDQVREKLKVTLLGGDSIDVSYFYPDIFPFFQDNGSLMPLDDIITQAGYNKDDFEYLIPSKKDGKIYGIPEYVPGKWFLVYNKDIFDKAKVPYLDFNNAMTWDEMIDIAKKLTSGTGKDKIYGYLQPVGAGWSQLALNSAIQSTTYYKDDGTPNIDNPEFKAGFKRAFDILNTFKVSPSFADQITTKSSVLDIMNGKIGMIAQGTWILGWMADLKSYPRTWKYGVAPLPVPDSKKGTRVAWGANQFIAITNTCKNPVEAFGFVEILAKYDAARGNKPTLKKYQNPNQFADLAKQLEFDGITEEMLKSVVDPNPSVMVDEKATGGKIDGSYESIMMDSLNSYLLGKTNDLDAAIKDAKEKLDKAYSEAK